jgi:hypothetical protein
MRHFKQFNRVVRHISVHAATSVNWDVSDANGGEICIEVKNPTTLSDLCMAEFPNTW